MEKSANLLVEQSVEEQPFGGKLFYWMTGVGRVIIILTNLVVLGVFFSRFTLDSRISDLTEELQVQKTVLESIAPFEREITDFKKRLDIISNFLENERSFSSGIEKIEREFPAEITLTGLNVQGSFLTLRADSPTPRGFGDLATSLLKLYPIDEVSLTSCVYDKESGVFSFELVIPVKDKIFN